MSEIKLLPCPLCGGEAIQEAGERIVWYDEYEYFECVHCTNCKASVEGETVEEAVTKWNTRKAMERIIERICNVRNNTPSTDFKNGCNASLHQIHREIDIKVKEEGGIE